MEQAHVAGTYESAGQGGTSLWWIPLITGSLWIVFALIVFRFDYTTVSAISILLGCVCLAGALFQAISAFATVGLSTGITPNLPPSADIVLVLLMFLGRIGPLTLGSAIALRDRRILYELPKERPAIG